MTKKNNSLEDIAKLLPDGLTEQTLVQIAELVGKKISEEITKVKNDLSVKVSALMRNKVDSLKEQAIKELELENPTYRKAQLYETVAAIFSVENTTDDETHAAEAMFKISEDLQDKTESLLTEVDRLSQENIKLKNAAKFYYDKTAKLEEQVKQVESSKNKLTEATKNEVKSKFSDVALVISEDHFKFKGIKEALKSVTNESKTLEPLNEEAAENEFLTPEMLARLDEISK